MHIPLNLFVAVARGEEPRELLDEISKEHVSAFCPVCTETILAAEVLLRRPGAFVPEESRDPVERLRRRLGLAEVELQKHVEEARGWVRAALKLDPEVRRQKVFKAYVRFKGPLFCHLLLEEARGRIPGDPAEARSLADAVLASNESTRVYRPDPEVQAPALAVRGNAQRALGRLVAAEADLEESRRLLDSPGVTDPGTPAEVHSYLGSLRKDQGRLEEAVHHLHRAAALYGLLRDSERAARVLLKLGLVHYVAHDFQPAVAVTEEALGLLDAGSDSWLRAYAHYNLAHHLHAAGEIERAEAELAAHEERIEAASDQLANLLVWLKARIAWSRGELRAAERLFTEARKRSLERGIAWDAGLIALELALVLLIQGKTARVKRLAREALGVFAEQDVERETRAALELLEAAARHDAVTRNLVEKTLAALERARPARAPATPPPPGPAAVSPGR